MRAITDKKLIPLMLALFLLTACGTLEVGIEQSPSERAAGAPSPEGGANEGPESVLPPMTPTPIPADYAPPTPEPAATPLPLDAYPSPEGLRVAFLQDGDLWLWQTEEGEPVRLIDTGDIDNIKLSDDGTVVAFQRGGEVWEVDSDGTGERPLLSGGDFEAMEEPGGLQVRLKRFAWVPGTHTIAFNTYLRPEAGDIPADDLRLVDADTLAQVLLLPPGEGGEFHYSPDGSQIAIVTSGDISLVDADGGNRQDSVLTYSPVDMFSADNYYAHPVWAADGRSLMAAIPPVNPHSQEVGATTIWRIPADGTSASHVTDILAIPEERNVAFSHEFNYMAYVEIPQPGADPTEWVQVWLKVIRLENGDMFAFPYYGPLFGWAPNSRHFAFMGDVGGRNPRFQISQWSGPTLPGSVDTGIPIESFRWVNRDYYVLMTRHGGELGAEGDSYELILTNIDGASTVLASAAGYFIFDLAIR